MKHKINDNSYFVHSDELELIFITSGILGDEKTVAKYEGIYSDNYIKEIRTKYKLLSEIINSLPNKGLGILEQLLIYDKDVFNIDEYEKFLLSLEKDLFFYRFFGEYIDIDTIRTALLSDDFLSDMFNKHKVSNSFITLKYLFSSSDDFIKSFFSCARSLRTNEFISFLSSKKELIEKQQVSIENMLQNDDGLSLSEKLMGKSFYNRGPYSKFTFMPSFMLPIKHIRYFDINEDEKQQILFYTVDNEKNNEEIINILKVLGDETRFKIIDLLACNKPMNGRDLASSLNIATSTISHHMDLLKSVGLINEERNKNSKFYSLNSNTSKELIKCLDNILVNKE